MRIGIDMGGTKIAAGLVHHGKIIDRLEVPTGKSRQEILKQLDFLITELSRGKKVERIGIGIPGVVQGTKLITLANVPWMNGVDLKRALKRPIAVENDARCFALAEHAHGAAKGKNAVCLIIGTGIGSGIIIDGKLYKGNGAAGEAGHQIHNMMLRSFVRGSGDWEEVLSGPGIVRRHKARGGKERSPPEIWASRSKTAGQTREETFRLLAIFIANIQVVLDPEVIVLGGGVSNLDLAAGVNRLLPKYRARPIVRNKKLQDAGIIGAALL